MRLYFFLLILTFTITAETFKPVKHIIHKQDIDNYMIWGEAAEGDIDNDGDIDIVWQYHDHIVAYRNDGLGNFTLDTLGENSRYYGIESLEIVDLNNDGWLDILMGNDRYASAQQVQLRILKNMKDGTFSLEVPALYPYRVSGMSVGDVNGDGLMDILTGSEYSPDNVLSIHYNLGDFTFSHDTLGITKKASYNPVFLVEDFDSNGLNDIIFTTGSSASMAIYFQDSLGHFTYSGLTGCSKVTSFDFDGNGFKDIFTIDPNDYNQLLLFRNNGDRTFIKDTVLTKESLGYVLDADYNNDGKKDLVVSSWYHNDDGMEGYVGWLENMGDGTFSDITILIDSVDSCKIETVFLSCADYNGDSLNDFVRVTSNISSASQAGGTTGMTFYSQKSGNSFSAEKLASLYWDANGLTVKDLNNDGYPDLIYAYKFYSRAVYRINNGDGTFGDEIVVNNEEEGLTGITGGDFDGDGDEDFVTGTFTNYNASGNVKVHTNNEGTFSTAELTSASYFRNSQMLSFDYTGDGIDDLLFTAGLGNNSSNKMVAYDVANNVQLSIPSNLSIANLFPVNLDSDSTLEFITCSGSFILAYDNPDPAKYDLTCDTLFMDTTGSYKYGYTYSADYDGDGKGDLFIREDDTISVHTNNGDGSFSFRKDHYLPGLADTNVASIIPSDLNGDDKIDLFLSFADKEWDRYSYFWGENTGKSEIILHQLDITADERPDLAIADVDMNGSNDLVVLKNDGTLDWYSFDLPIGITSPDQGSKLSEIELKYVKNGNVYCFNSAAPIAVDFYSLNGKLVSHSVDRSNNSEKTIYMDRFNLASGNYLCTISSGLKKSTFKVTIRK